MQRSQLNIRLALRLSDALGKPVPGWLGRVLGAGFFVIGLLLGFGAVTALHLATKDGRTLTSAGFSAAVFFGLPAILLLTTGLRLILQRPNKFRSLLRPLVWFLLCGVFVLLTFVCVAAIFAVPGTELIDGVGSAAASAFFALLSYGAGSNAARRVRSSS